MWNRWVVCAMGIASVGCSSPCYPAFRADYTEYRVAPTRYSAFWGYGVDDPKHELDQERLDTTVGAVVACIHQFMDAPLTREERVRNDCLGAPTLEVRSCLTIKVAPDWYRSPCSTEEIFPCTVPNASCEVKGLTPTPECPCSCRGIIQGDAIIITPNMRLLAGQLTQMLTGCEQPWAGRMAECAGIQR